MPTKFYAVRAGHSPGIYYDWNDCLQQVKGFKSAIFKSFTTLTEAQDFLTSTTTTRSIAKPKHKTPKFYGVRRGHVPGVYTEWESAEAQIKGFKGPIYKSFKSHAEADAFVKIQDSSLQAASQSPSNQQLLPSAPTDVNPPSAKRRKTTNDIDNSTPVIEQTNQLVFDDYEPGEGPLPYGATDGFDPRITLNPNISKVEYKSMKHLNQTKWQATNPIVDAPLKIWTDGSSLGNGSRGAIAGVGVYFGPQSTKNVSEALIGSRQTNQRAELTAIQRALELSPRNRPLQIYTDSNYAIKCVTDWYVQWRKNGWLNSQKKAVENKDLIEKILALLEERHMIGGSRSKVEFIWVKGHANDEGNNAADQLAVAGAKEAQSLIARGIVNPNADGGEQRLTGS